MPDVKTSSPSAAPRRSSWKWLGALLAATLALGGVLLPISRGAVDRFQLFPASEVSPLQNPAPQSRRKGSLSKALTKLDAKVVQAYFKRWSSQEKSDAAGAMSAVYIDAEALAHHHPAWQLAQHLEVGAISPSSPQIARVLAPFRGVADNASLAATHSRSLQSRPPRAGAGVILSAALPNSSDARQNSALERFLAQSAARDAARASDEALLSRRALEDETARAQRATVSERDLPVLPPDVALELLNLRLELLRNLSRTPTQRAAARGDIAIIEARYAEILRQQTEAQAARLRAVTIEAPQRARREGLLQIERERQISAQSGARQRRETARETRELLRRDAAQNSALRMELPPLRALQLPSQRTAEATIGPSDGAARQIIETAGAAPASMAPLEKTVRDSGIRRQLAFQLRQKARQDSARWARESAAYLGKKWSRDPKLPDATPRARKLMFPTYP